MKKYLEFVVETGFIPILPICLFPLRRIYCMVLVQTVRGLALLSVNNKVTNTNYCMGMGSGAH